MNTEAQEQFNITKNHSQKIKTPKYDNQKHKITNQKLINKSIWKQKHNLT